MANVLLCIQTRSDRGRAFAPRARFREAGFSAADGYHPTTTARGAITALQARGVIVPDQVAVVGFDNWAVMAEAVQPALTTVDLKLHEIGREAGRHLLAMIDGESRSGIIRTPCHLVVRDSYGARPVSSFR